MYSYFSEYYRPTNVRFAQLWDEAVFVFDTNVLLNLYCYRESARDDFFKVMERLQDQLWLPHQVAQEYHDNRLEVILTQASAYDFTMGKIADIRSSFDAAFSEIRNKYSRHVRTDMADLNSIADEAIARMKETVHRAKSAYPAYFESDIILERLTELFADRVGPSYPVDLLSKLYEKAEERLSRQCPPGYMDRDKAIPGRYGDAIIWFQLLDYAKEQKKPIIFVTEDQKDDWWNTVRGKTYGPALELMREMKLEADVPFYMYRQDRFVAFANQVLGVFVQNETIEEVREVQRRDPVLVHSPQASFAHSEKKEPLPPVSEEELQESRHRVEFARQALYLEEIREAWPLVRRIVRKTSRRMEALLASADPYDVRENTLILLSAYDFHRDGINKRGHAKSSRRRTVLCTRSTFFRLLLRSQ